MKIIMPQVKRNTDRISGRLKVTELEDITKEAI